LLNRFFRLPFPPPFFRVVSRCQTGQNEDELQDSSDIVFSNAALLEYWLVIDNI
jgi:hypothetical protein